MPPKFHQNYLGAYQLYLFYNVSSVQNFTFQSASITSLVLMMIYRSLDKEPLSVRGRAMPKYFLATLNLQLSPIVLDHLSPLASVISWSACCPLASIPDILKNN